ncbi:MAG: hypothetical protein B6244_00225 [Candidatus Cloacimonetes bacterium 4572_55]|nr:MAG: hypothetical protein B6244_00225 [Candidatus Cloacimonetes bacterium 4572_55]
MKSIMGCFSLIILLPTLLISHAYAEDLWTTVSSDHSIYPFLERMQNRGIISPIGEIRPVTRREIIDRIIHISDRLEKIPDLLTDKERAQLSGFCIEFADELPKKYRVETQHARLRFNARQIDGRLHPRRLFVYTKDANGLYISVLFNERIVSRAFNREYDDELVFRHGGGVICRGYIGDKLGFYIRAANYLEQGTYEYNPKEQNVLPNFAKISGDRMTYDKTDAYFGLNVSPIYIKFGKDRVEWGPGFNGKLSLSDNAGSFTHLALTTRIGPVLATHLTGFLNSRTTTLQTDDQGNQWKETVGKYLAGHRAEVTIKSRAVIGAQEIIIYGNRGLEAAYLNPFNFYRSAEHDLHDKDNASMQLDATVFPAKNWRIHAVWFIDDLYMGKFFDHVFNNKFGLQAGFFYTGFPNIEIKAEYTRVDQWVYSHYLPINTFSHDDRILGHWIGPDSDDLFFEISYDLLPELKTALTFERIRSGDLSDFTIPYTERTTDSKRFLEGHVEREYRIGFHIDYEPFGETRARINLNLNDLKNKDHIVGKDAILICFVK